MTKKEATVVCIKPIVKKTAKIRIIGDSPLIVHAWSEKAKKELLASQQGTKLKKDKKQAKNVYGEIAEALYWMNGKPDVAYADWTEELLDEYARPKESVLHDDFEWRDEVAAEKYRQGQARHMIGAIRITSEDTQEPVRAYVNVTVVAPDEPLVRSYMPMKEVLEHPDLYSQMMADAFRDAQSFKQKYNTLERLKPVMDAIDKAFDADQIKHEQMKMAAGMEASIKGEIR